MAIKLSSLVRKSEVKIPQILLYGVQGIGKTTLATRFESPLFICAEEGLSGIAGVDYTRVKSFNEVDDLLIALHNDEHSFKHVVIDTVSAFEPMLHQHMIETENARSIETVGGGYSKWRVEALPYWEHVLRGLDSLREKQNIGSVLIGHSQSIEERPPDGDPFRKYSIDLLNPRAINLLYRRADIVAFCNYRVHTKITKHEQISKGKVVKEKESRAIGTGERIMYLEERPAWYAKNRYELPAEVPLTAGTSFQELVQKTNTGEQ